MKESLIELKTNGLEIDSRVAEIVKVWLPRCCTPDENKVDWVRVDSSVLWDAVSVGTQSQTENG